MRRYLITIISILCLALILSSFIYKTNAVGLSAITNPEDFINNSDDSSKAKPIANVIIWLVRTIGESISVIMLIVIGIKYILGSVEEKAEYKKSMWPYVLGAVLLFSGSALTDVIYKAFN